MSHIDRKLRLLVVLVVLALVGAACARANDEPASSPPEEPGTESNEAEPDEQVEAEPDEPIELEPDEPIEVEPDNQPWTIDTSVCPSNWDPTTGLSDTEVKFGISAPQSGPLAVLNFLGAGIDAYFNYANAELGGVNGRDLVLIRKDDAYDPTRTVTNVSALVESDKVFGLVNVLGTPNNLAVWDDLNAQCIPHVFTGAGTPEWGDVENHPWTTGSFMSYTTETAMWTEYLQSQFPEGATVATIEFDNEFGESYANGFAEAIQGTNLEVVASAGHEGFAPNLQNQITTLAASNADVLLVMTTSTFCPETLQRVAEAAWEPLVIMSATCAAPQVTFFPIEPAGDGTLFVATQKTLVADSADEDVQFYFEKVAQYGEGIIPTVGIVSTGWEIGGALRMALLEADASEAGLNRVTLMQAIRSLDYQPPLNLDGVPFRLDGDVDAYLTESGVMRVYDVASRSYSDASDLYDYEGAEGTFTSGE